MATFITFIRRIHALILISQNARKPDHFGGVFAYHRDPQKKPEKEEEKKIKGILERLRHYGIDNINESNVEYALHSRSSQGDPEAAFRMLMMLEDTYEGIIKPYSVDTKLVGAINRDGITCYLDTLLFAMFAKLDSFEAMLYDNFEDIKRKRLAGLLRLWVNMLRTGRLITTDVTEQIQRALVDCGWADAGRHRQQDPSEAFTFITGQLELPMLTLKMDMYHTGKEDPHDDHKFVNERLLEVAILDEAPDGRDVITLEDCLEHYFNNRIEVKRYREYQRRNTLKGASLAEGATKMEKASATHVEVVEVGPETPVAESPAVLTPAVDVPIATTSALRPTVGRKRQDSIFSQRKIEVVNGVDPDASTNTDEATPGPDSKLRKMSTRTEVLMPAWQFFKLLPWYTDNMPTSDAQVAAHFSKKRPVLGICLKRYSYTNTGQARRLDTYIDIPTEIAVPNFVSDDSMHEEGPLVGNFRLVLQSVVCHRGTSVHSGHYICLCRGHPSTKNRHLNPGERRGSLEPDEDEDRWNLFDDLHVNERIREVDIHEALKKEVPYLLFYQVLPIGDDDSHHELPSYHEAVARSQSDAIPMEKPFSNDNNSEQALNQVLSAPAVPAMADRTSTEPSTVRPTASPRISLEVPDARRKSVTLDTASTADSNAATNSIPTTPSEEKANNNSTTLLSVLGSRRGSRVSRSSATGTGISRSRPTSTGPPDGSGNGNGRFSLNMTKLTQRLSRSEVNSDVPVIQPSEHVAAELAGQKDAATGVEKPAPEKAGVVNAPQNASRESVGAGTGTTTGHAGTAGTARPGGKIRKEKGSGKKKEERDCVVM